MTKLTDETDLRTKPYIEEACCLKSSEVFLKSFVGASGKFQGVSRVFFMGIQENSEGLSSRFPGEFREGFKDLYRSFKEVSRKFLNCLIEFKALMRMFQGCSVFLILVLHVTHRSYPIRRRACLPQIWTQTF